MIEPPGHPPACSRSGLLCWPAPGPVWHGAGLSPAVLGEGDFNFVTLAHQGLLAGEIIGH